MQAYPRRVGRRSLLTAGLATVTTSLLAACGGTTVADGSPSTATKTATVATPAQAKLQPANLKVWVWWPDPVETLQEAGRRFAAQHANTSVRVEAPTDYWIKLQTALAGGAGPDVYFMNSVNYAAWSAKDILLDLDPLIGRDKDVQAGLAEFWQEAITYYKFKGKNFGLPYMYTTVVLYYQVDRLKQAGLTPPAELKEKFTWERLREYAVKLTTREGERITHYGFLATEGIETGWLNFIRANGGDYLSSDRTKCIVDEPASVDAMMYLADLALNAKVSPSPEALQAENSRSLFMTGKIALWPSGSWVMKTLNAQLKDFTYDIALMPFAPETGKTGGTTNIVGLVINKGSKAQEQSWALLKEFLSKDAQDMLAKADILAPVRNDSAALYYDPKQGPANRRAAMEMQKWTTPLPAHDKVTYPEMMKPTTQWQNEIFQGRIGVKDGLQKLAADVNALFAAAK